MYASIIISVVLVIIVFLIVIIVVLVVMFVILVMVIVILCRMVYGICYPRKVWAMNSYEPLTIPGIKNQPETMQLDQAKRAFKNWDYVWLQKKNECSTNNY